MRQGIGQARVSRSGIHDSKTPSGRLQLRVVVLRPGGLLFLNFKGNIAAAGGRVSPIPMISVTGCR